MKFKKSISFVLTLCMVLSLFATFVIPVAAEGAASQVVENWDVANWNDGVNTSNAAYIFTDASVYSSTTAYAWWRHVAFAPTATEGVYEVTEIAVGTGGEGGGLTVPENGFVWTAFEWPESGSGVYALNVMNAVEVGDSVKFTGVDFANKTAAADATAEKWVDPSAPVNVALGKDYVLSGCGNRASYYGDLTDGASVNALGSNNNVDWFGFYCNGDNMDDINAPEKVGTVVIDLGAMYDISSMRTKTIAMPSWGIAAAGAINFYASADGVEYTLVGSGVVTTDEAVGYWSGTDCEVTAQFVKLEVKLAGTFAFINEFEVYGTEAVVDDESYKDTYVHADGVNVGTIQQLGDAWADKLTLDFWYLVEDGETTVTVNYAVDNKVVLDDDTMFRVWVDADITDTARTTLYDYKVSAGEAYNAKHASSINEAIVSAEYTVVGNDYFFTLVLDKATLGIDGEYRLNLQLGQSNSTTMHSIKYDNVTGEGATYAPWNTTEFYEVFGKAPEAPVTSQVVTDWNVSDWSTSANGANGAYLFTDQEAYLACTHTWWSHISFKPTTIAGVYEVAAIRGATGEAASFEIAEGGFVLAAHDTAAAGTAGAYVHALIKSLAVGDRVIFNGLNIADLTTTADATAVLVPTAEDMDLLVSHNYNYNWHCFEGQIITMAVGEAGLKKAGDAPNMTAEDTDILYIVELVDGAYKVTGVVGGKALLDVEIPENGFLYYVTKNCTGYDKICHGELVGKYLVLGEIDLATKFAIDTQAGSPAKVMKAVSSFKTGDADLDGKITATDYAIVRKLVLGTLTAEDIGELAYKAADVNGNGKVDARDYYLVKRAFLGTYVIPGWEAEDAE